MKHSRLLLAGICFAIVAPAILSKDLSAFAPPGSRPYMGKPHYGSSTFRSSRNMNHARDYSRDLYYYTRDAQTIDPELARSESTELARNIDATKKELATIRKEYAGDKEVLASLKVIEDHLTNATAQHKTLHAECQMDTFDRTAGMKCCSDITKELEKAMAEHAALMRKLEIKELANSKKETTPKK
ncbi:hypothetical protein [Gimesia maris]|uniref:hypothetical protein n=1 Tax=Gimesia maris TaxID=122 RepID=UPI00241FF6D1|nr:hypothetical protein [Gimesia maris]|tara:strand:- start:250723 stop:251280 length:558 start_codon:yes stop_codon:yes gene_type:complete